MIYVFKTSVKNLRDVALLQPKLNRLIEDNGWSFDLEDCDKVLRVVSNKLKAIDVMDLLRAFSYECEEL